MILVDYSQVCIANYMQAVGKYTNTPVELDVIRHMILNSLRAINSKFRTQYGKMVIAVDDHNSWRKDIFPFYKANRKAARSSTDVDWAALFRCMATVKEEIKEFMPYTVIEVEKAEADDIIARLSRLCVNTQEMCLIISGDHDFIQLQIDNIFVKQYDTKHDRWITHAEPKRYLFEHVIKGDLGDGIPNVYSLDDHYITKANRAPKVTTKKLEQMWTEGPGELVSSPHFKRNVMLIDLKKTPQDIQSDIEREFHFAPEKNKSKVLNYFIDNNLRLLTKSIGDF